MAGVATAAEPLPYAINFRTSCEGWTAVDHGNDNYTWKTDFMPDYGVYMENSGGNHNDDYLSPAFSLKKGVKYMVKVCRKRKNPPLNRVHR